MGRRGFNYRWGIFWRYYVCDGLPTLLLSFVARCGCQPEKRHGFLILDPERETRVEFTTLVSDALELIAQSDRIRFNRVCAQIRSVMNGMVVFGSTYTRALKMGTLHLKFFARGNDRETTVRFLASALVKEATFGHLVSRGVLPTRRNYSRFVNVCLNEAQRFLQQLGIRNSPWDQERLPMVTSRFEGLVHGFKEMRESDRDRAERKTSKKPHSNDEGPQ